MKRQSETILMEMTQRLVTEFHPKQVILFGSYAWGQPNEDSDVDLMVVLEKSDQTPMQRALRARRILRGLNVPKDILVRTDAELVQARRVAASLENTILKQGKCLYDG